jgi:hypothetical protein
MLYMAEKYFVSGLLLLSFFGSLILLLNRGFGSTSSTMFIAVLAILAIISLTFLGDIRKGYNLMMVYFLAALILCAFLFAEGSFDLMLWLVTVTSLVGFAITIAGPMSAGKPAKKAASKKAAASKELPAKEKPKVTVIKKASRKKKK